MTLLPYAGRRRLAYGGTGLPTRTVTVAGELADRLAQRRELELDQPEQTVELPDTRQAASSSLALRLSDAAWRHMLAEVTHRPRLVRPGTPVADALLLVARSSSPVEPDSPFTPSEQRHYDRLDPQPCSAPAPS